METCYGHDRGHDTTCCLCHTKNQSELRIDLQVSIIFLTRLSEIVWKEDASYYYESEVSRNPSTDEIPSLVKKRYVLQVHHTYIMMSDVSQEDEGRHTQGCIRKYSTVLVPYLVLVPTVPVPGN
jgi:hypothetical protein